MKKGTVKSGIGILLCLLLLFPTFCLSVSADGAPCLSAQSAVLYQPDTASFPLEKAADLPLPMASTTKIMTALTVLALLSPDETVSVPKAAVGVEGSSAYLLEGEVLTVKDLLYALLLQSANDAAVTLALHACGSVEAFADEMNLMATQMGLHHTHFQNPHGLPADEHFTTARELAIMTAAAMEIPLFCDIVATKIYRVTTSERQLVFVNHNKLLRFSEDAIGVKTGFTKASGRCLVGAAERDGVRLISVTLNAPSDWQDHEKMWEFGFDRYERRTLVSANEYHKNILVFGAIKPFVTVTNSEGLSAVVPKNAKIRFVPSILPYPPLPIKEGQTLGTLEIFADDECVGTLSLCATEDLSPLTKRKLFH